MSADHRRPAPRVPVRPRKIRRFNVVTLVLLLLAAALFYAGWKLIPPWWGQFRVREIMGEVAFAANRTRDPAALDRILVERLGEIGVTPLEEPVWTWTDTEVRVKLRYQVAIRHPVLLPPTVLDFAPEVTAPRGAGIL